jgi:hypothetical protein
VPRRFISVVPPPPRGDPASLPSWRDVGAARAPPPGASAPAVPASCEVQLVERQVSFLLPLHFTRIMLTV